MLLWNPLPWNTASPAAWHTLHSVMEAYEASSSQFCKQTQPWANRIEVHLARTLDQQPLQCTSNCRPAACGNRPRQSQQWTPRDLGSQQAAEAQHHGGSAARCCRRVLSRWSIREVRAQLYPIEARRKDAVL